MLTWPWWTDLPHYPIARWLWSRSTFQPVSQPNRANRQPAWDLATYLSMCLPVSKYHKQSIGHSSYCHHNNSSATQPANQPARHPPKQPTFTKTQHPLSTFHHEPLVREDQRARNICQDTGKGTHGFVLAQPDGTLDVNTGQTKITANLQKVYLIVRRVLSITWSNTTPNPTSVWGRKTEALEAWRQCSDLNHDPHF